ncbi:hypothetical protein F3Y22_tig00116997pilonHSYRG00642 [Hibiscus syriacus]|uniref:Uncharacterized protein n=1 Tax=Hibiscus syriacus TaxID=106335 RepID=A0A6A2X4L6_HIBSY|nr:hypothetical protein F3Y22_tig00116997pilonHSYRG00642 [Hibiscus syriacus]
MRHIRWTSVHRPLDSLLEMPNGLVIVGRAILILMLVLWRRMPSFMPDDCWLLTIHSRPIRGESNEGGSWTNGKKDSGGDSGCTKPVSGADGVEENGNDCSGIVGITGVGRKKFGRPVDSMGGANVKGGSCGEENIGTVTSGDKSRAGGSFGVANTEGSDVAGVKSSSGGKFGSVGSVRRKGFGGGDKSGIDGVTGGVSHGNIGVGGGERTSGGGENTNGGGVDGTNGGGGDNDGEDEGGGAEVTGAGEGKGSKGGGDETNGGGDGNKGGKGDGNGGDLL